MKLDFRCESDCIRRCVGSFNEFLIDNSVEERIGDKGVLVALSGGADSVLLLYLMKQISSKYGTYIKAAHVNHNIRGKEADRDELFCRELCQSMDIDIEVLSFDVPAYAKNSGKGLEEAARDVRYEFFDSVVASDSRLGFVATAHNADDNLETLLLNLLRGSGTRGLAGIPPIRGNIIRPLLYIKKSDILSALSELGVDHITDSTNFDTDIKRNFIRNKIVPLLEEVAKDPQISATRAAKCLRFDADALDDVAASALSEILCVGEHECYIDRRRLSEIPEAIACRVLNIAIERKMNKSPSLSFSHTKALIKKCTDDDKYFRICLPDGIVAIGKGNRVFFDYFNNADKESVDYNIALGLGENIIPGVGVVYLSSEPIEVFEGDSVSFSNGCNIFSEKDDIGSEFAKSLTNVYKIFIQADLSSAKIIGNLSARNRRASDAYKYGGITRSLKKLFSDRKIPIDLRDKIPVIYDERGIVWVPGFGVRDESDCYNSDSDNSAHFWAYFRLEN